MASCEHACAGRRATDRGQPYEHGFRAGNGAVRLFVVGLDRRIRVDLEPRVDGLALQGQDAEDALVDPVQRLTGDETLQGLDAKREFANCASDRLCPRPRDVGATGGARRCTRVRR